MKRKYPALIERVLSESKSFLAVSAITVAELEYGIAKSLYPVENRDALLEFLTPLEIIPFTETECENFGFLRAYLNRKGTPIGPYDIQIAAQTISRDLCLVTNNIKEFERVPGLRFENWVE